MSSTAESEFTFDDLIKASISNRDDHRKQFNDGEWQNQQPRGLPKYKIGDVIEFHAGGFGVIREVRKGHVPAYSTEEIEGKPFHPRSKVAWHYEGDFKNWIAKSPLHTL